MIIDAKNSVVGRVAAFAAKKSLLGEEVHVVNCGESYITGKKMEIKKRFQAKIKMGSPHHGPFIHREAFKIVKRAIRGMLPYKQYRGKIAFARIKCYDDVPEKFKNEKMEIVKGANINKLKLLKYIKLIDLSVALRSR